MSVYSNLERWHGPEGPPGGGRFANRNKKGQVGGILMPILLDQN
jgi:hypothetical protein